LTNLIMLAIIRFDPRYGSSSAERCCLSENQVVIFMIGCVTIPHPCRGVNN